MSYRLFLDDERFPLDEMTAVPWVIARSSEEAIEITQRFGIPSFISFDHDLGGNDTSIIYINWLIEHCLNFKDAIFPTDFYVHSQNPVGAQNIYMLMRSAIQHFQHVAEDQASGNTFAFAPNCS